MPSIEVRAEKMAAGGDAIARMADGRVAFVRGALPDELVAIDVVQAKKDFVRAEVTDVIEPSPHRVEPPCVGHAAGCGGCTWQHVAAGAQLRLKAAVVTEALRRTGRIAEPVVDIGDAVPPWAYRTTLRLASGLDRLGLRGRSSHDVVELDGCPVSHPLLERMLASSPSKHGLVRYSAHLVGDGAEAMRNACAMALEGLVSKRIDLPYRSGRNGDWTKSKCVMADPFVVIGYVPSNGASDVLGSLVVGFHDEGGMVYAGRVGSGFTMDEARAILGGLEAIRRKSAPVTKALTRQRQAGVQWVTPTIVAQVAYRAVTADAVLRHASFQHFRVDKRPDEIRRPAAFSSGWLKRSAVDAPARPPDARPSRASKHRCGHRRGPARSLASASP